MAEKDKKILSTDPYKGVRDFYPEDQEIQNYIFRIWKESLHHFGFEEYNASILEPAEIYQSKTSTEIVNEQTYTFKDRGDRTITLRPEMTPSVARLIAGKRKSMSFPKKWFSIPNVFRYERPQRGRLREHWQLNADIFGTAGPEADIEMISLAVHIFDQFGIARKNYQIEINDRQALNDFLQQHNIPEQKHAEVIRLLDTKKKNPDFEEALLRLTNTPLDFNTMKSARAQTLITHLKTLGIHNVVFNPFLARGFDYYTGIVFEAFDTKKDNNRSLVGGGRYDNLLSLFNVEPIPAIGFGMGDVTIRDVLETYDLLPKTKTKVDVFISALTESAGTQTHLLATVLREKTIRTYTDFTGKKIADQIKRAEEKRARFVIFIGDDELQTKKYKIKCLADGTKKTLSEDELAPYIISHN